MTELDLYFKKIDGLRFVAIAFVIIEHFANFIGKNIKAGYFGVDLFFVISGFLITSILLKPNCKTFGENYKNFIGRRTLRIFPLYYLTIIILWFLNFENVRTYLAWFLTYSFNYAWPYYNLPVNRTTHFWSLSVEEQFYLFWPLIVLSLKKNQIFLMYLTISIICFGYLQLCFNIFPSISKYNNSGLLTRMASLGAGGLGAILYSRDILPKKILLNKPIEYFILILLIITLLTDYKIHFLVMGFCSLFLVLKAAYYDFRLNILNIMLSNKNIVWIGTISYGIYLFHPIIAYYLDTYCFNILWSKIDFSFCPILEWHPWIFKLPIYSFITVIVAALSMNFFEKPILLLKDRWFKYNRGHE